MIIRDAKKDEVGLIREQRVAAYGEHAEKIPEGHWEALRKAITSDADLQPGVELIVAEDGENVVGSVALFPAQSDAYEGYVEEMDYPEIRLLAVSPEARGKGVAVKLVEECIRRTREKGYGGIGLHTADFMEAAMKLYKSLGFERMPEYDFEPENDGIIVKAFRLKLK
ncbi:MAG: GNAT family N-acetyltransferase [Bacillus sp. (in: Bacteria)]|nr:GNAT family N-acetyltransferase [Bacillus sp. (in: firmicutes)]